ncbi:hypothetical protein GF357_04105 [Candidatus Dojkabacteria bacterium]|nr:hypothetical protein [Candidatus Dojkabacteria bacterium]
MTRKELESKRTPCEVYSRVVGYLSPVKNWNRGKKSEWNKRKNYNSQKSPSTTARKMQCDC